MLGGDAELLFQVLPVPVLLQQLLVLAVDLPGVEQEFRPVLGQGDPSSAAVEDGDAQLFFQFLHGAGQGGLGDIEEFRGLVQGTFLRDGDGIMQLL